MEPRVCTTIISIPMATARGCRQVSATQDAVLVTRNGPREKVYDTGGFTEADTFRVVERVTSKRTALQQSVDFRVR